MAQNERQAREERARLRTYQARQEVQSHQVWRRKRDNFIGVLVFVAVAAVAVGAYLVYIHKQDQLAAANASVSATPTPTGTGTLPDKSVAENRDWTGTLTVNNVALNVTLYGSKAPQAVASEVTLAKNGFYTGLSCFRLTTGNVSVLQCGDPQNNGSGGPGYKYGPIENAPSNGVYPAGTLAMARIPKDGNSMGSQFFICYGDSVIPSDSAGGYTVFGTITGGLDQLKAAITNQGTSDGSADGKPKVDVKITNFTVQ